MPSEAAQKRAIVSGGVALERGVRREHEVEVPPLLRVKAPAHLEARGLAAVVHLHPRAG